MTDDMENKPYGGVVYMYNSTHVRLIAPNRNHGYASGFAIYTGM